MADVTDVRAALRSKMINDTTLKSLMGGTVQAFNHPPRQPKAVPAIVFWDMGTRPDVTVPLHDRTVTIQAWATKYEDAEGISKRLRALFDKQPLTISGNGWRFQGMYWTDDVDEPLEEGIDYVSRTQRFRLLVYEVG